MIRLLIVLVVIALATVFLVMRNGKDQKPEVIYQQNVDTAKAVEQQMQDQAKQQLQDIDKATTQPKVDP